MTAFEKHTRVIANSDCDKCGGTGLCIAFSTKEEANRVRTAAGVTPLRAGGMIGPFVRMALCSCVHGVEQLPRVV